MRIPMLTLMLTIPAAPLTAQQADTASTPPQRIRSVTVQRGEECPKSSGDEVVVCTTIIEPYRIPNSLRRGEPSAANQSWVNRTAYADQVGRVAGGLPDTCSPVGTGGQTGCAMTWNRAYAAEKTAKKREAESVPGGEDAPIAVPVE